MAERSQDYILDEQIGYILRLANQRHGLIFQQHTIDNLTPTQFSALVRISQNGECSQNQLGRLAAMDVATIKGVVDRLAHKGLIASRADPNDKRRTLLSLTGAGRDLLARMKAVGLQISADTMEPLSKSEQATLLKILRKIT